MKKLISLITAVAVSVSAISFAAVTFADTASLHPVKGLKSVGSSFITVGKGVYNITKLAASGVFGICYEFVDEAKYIFVPNTTNDSSLNPDEVLTIIY